VENNTTTGLTLVILSPEGEICRDTADEITLPTQMGMITVLPSHTPLFTKLSEGEVRLKKAGEEHFVGITGGFLEIINNMVRILADYAVSEETVEEVKAEQARKKAEELLKNQKDKQGQTLAEHELHKAILQLKIVDHLKKRHHIKK
jgi:F-type H+-transporting ATPase subunit epsilon